MSILINGIVFNYNGRYLILYKYEKNKQKTRKMYCGSNK